MRPVAFDEEVRPNTPASPPRLLLTEPNRGARRQCGHAEKQCATKVLTCRVSQPEQTLCPACSAGLDMNLRYDIFSPYDDRTGSVLRRSSPQHPQARLHPDCVLPEARAARAHWLLVLPLSPLRHYSMRGRRMTRYICCVKPRSHCADRADEEEVHTLHRNRIRSHTNSFEMLTLPRRAPSIRPCPSARRSGIPIPFYLPTDPGTSQWAH